MTTSYIDDERKRQIAGRARTLHERLDGPANVEGEPRGVDGDRLVEAFAESYDSDAAFERRLAWDGLDVETLRNHAEATTWPVDEPLPDWLDDLDDLAAYLAERSTAERRRARDQYGDQPFVHLLSVVVEYARERLSDEAAPGTVAPSALAPTAEWLLDRLVTVSSDVLYEEFDLFRSDRDETTEESAEEATVAPDEDEEPPTDRYDQFVDAMFGHGFANLSLRYPVLARLVVTLVEQWVTFVESFCRRLREDRPRLDDRFGVDPDAAVASLRPLARDTHERGTCPLRVTFEDDTEVVYKPRSVATEKAFHDVLDRLADYDSVPSHRSPEFVTDDGYGWMEWVSRFDPSTEAAVERYYERAGVLLWVATVLRLNDCHLENVVVHGEHPIVVDAETVCSPHLDPDGMELPTAVGGSFQSDALWTGLLPWTYARPRNFQNEMFGQVGGIAGIGSDSEPVELAESTAFEAVNTDRMATTRDEQTLSRTVNTVTFDGEDRPPAEYVESLVDGFETAYDLVRELREAGRFRSEILDPALDDGLETRLLYRSTVTYTELKRSITSAEALVDGLHVSRAFERLVVPYFDGVIEDGRHSAILDAERRALARFDVPRFTAQIDETDVLFDGEPVGVAADRSGLDGCLGRLEAMTDADRERQVDLLRRCFAPNSVDASGATAGTETDSARTRTTAEGSGVTPEGGPSSPKSSVGDRRLRQVAVECVESALDATVDTGTDRRDWVSFIDVGDEPGVTLIPAAHNLYSGRCGVALATAALSRATDEHRYAEVADEILRPVRDRLDGEFADPEHGGAFGVGSVLYALAAVGDLLDEPAYHDEALDAATVVTDEFVAADETFDVLTGSAGTLLGLLACYDRTDDPELLDRARACGDHLLTSGTTSQGTRTWETVDERTTAGFAHGTSGIAYALVRLGAVAGEHRYVDAGLEGLAHEPSGADPSRPDWSARHASVGERRDQWCVGRAGTALARLAVGELLSDDDLRSEARNGIEATAARGPLPADQLCCGNLGHADLFVEADRRLGGDWPARRTLERCLVRRERTGTFALDGHSDAIVNPTLFGGVTGVSYAIARLFEPETVPCVLLFE